MARGIGIFHFNGGIMLYTAAAAACQQFGVDIQRFAAHLLDREMFGNM